MSTFMGQFTRVWRVPALLVVSLFPAGLASGQEAPKTPQDEFFEENSFQDIRLEIHPSDWKRLQDNYLDNTYYPANLLWRGTFIENIGIRSKGRTSRRPN